MDRWRHNSTTATIRAGRRTCGRSIWNTGARFSASSGGTAPRTRRISFKPSIWKRWRSVLEAWSTIRSDISSGLRSIYCGAITVVQLTERIDLALANLPSPWRVALLRSRRDGWTYRQIADELHVSPHTVKKYIVKALAHLRTASR